MWHILLQQVESSANKLFNFKTHPNIDKNLYSDKNILGLKDPSRPFPTGNPLGILKWRMQSKQESLVPLSSKHHPSVDTVLVVVGLLLIMPYIYIYSMSICSRSVYAK